MDQSSPPPSDDAIILGANGQHDPKRCRCCAACIKRFNAHLALDLALTGQDLLDRIDLTVTINDDQQR